MTLRELTALVLLYRACGNEALRRKVLSWLPDLELVVGDEPKIKDRDELRNSGSSFTVAAPADSVVPLLPVRDGTMRMGDREGDQNQSTQWQPIETAPIALEDDDDIWIWAARRGRKLPMLTTWDHEKGHWYTFNLALEHGMRRGDLRWRWEPDLWIPVQEVPK